jgi:hypothetical protein
MKNVITIVTALFLSAGIYAQGFDATQAHPKAGSAIKILTHVDLNITRIKNVDEAGLGFHGGAIGVYKFSPFIGAHLGAQFNRIAASEDGVDFKAPYVDIPFGLTISYGNGFQGSTNFINIGGFFGVPVGDFKASGNLDEEYDLENMLGINFDTHTVWPVSDKLKIGLHAFFKFGLKEMIEVESVDTDAKYYAVGLGISSVFL